MLRITGRLRRIRYTRGFIQLIIWIVFSPLFVLYFLGKFAEYIMDKISNAYFRLENKVVRNFNLDNVARKQFATNPEKFKRK